MIGWRARLGFLVPPGNPTVEAEMMALAPAGVSLHFHRMAVGGGVPGALDNQDERTRTMIDSLDASVELLAMVKPGIIVVAHTATSYHLGRVREAELLARLTAATGIPVVTAFGSVVAALERLGVRRVALGAPYSAETTAQGKAHLEAHGFSVVKSRESAGRQQHLRRDRRACLWLGAAGRSAGGRGGVPLRHRDADAAGPRDARTGFAEAGDFERLGDDVAWSAKLRRAPADPRLRPPPDNGVSDGYDEGRHEPHERR